MKVLLHPAGTDRETRDVV